MVKPLLIEVGVEELPAIPLLKELKNIETKYAAILEKNSLLCEFEFYYTPRRLVFWHREFKSMQDDSSEEFFWRAAECCLQRWRANSCRTRFLLKKCGVEMSEISQATKDGKEVLYYKRELKGQASHLLLPNIIEEWIKSLEFGKSMRWGICKRALSVLSAG